MSFPILVLALALAGALVRPALCSDACPSASGRPGGLREAPAAGGTAPAGRDDPVREPAGVSVNHASAEDLQRLPGIGPRKAAALVEARLARPFRRASDLRRVKGFGARTVQRLAPLLVFD